MTCFCGHLAQHTPSTYIPHTAYYGKQRKESIRLFICKRKDAVVCVFVYLSFLRRFVGVLVCEYC